MNDWVVETPSFEEDLMNNKFIMLHQNGVNRVVEIIKEKNKEIERKENIINEIYKKANDTTITSLDVRNFILYKLEKELKEVNKNVERN